MASVCSCGWGPPEQRKHGVSPVELSSAELTRNCRETAAPHPGHDRKGRECSDPGQHDAEQWCPSRPLWSGGPGAPEGGGFLQDRRGHSGPPQFTVQVRLCTNFPLKMVGLLGDAQNIKDNINRQRPSFPPTSDAKRERAGRCPATENHKH